MKVVGWQREKHGKVVINGVSVRGYWRPYAAPATTTTPDEPNRARKTSRTAKISYLAVVADEGLEIRSAVLGLDELKPCRQIQLIGFILARSVPVITVAMLVTWLVLATVPSWIEKVGLYQYLGVEILIFAIYALAYNIVLGHAGLPSFGHGAFFGIGAYGFGLAQHNVLPNLWFCLGVATLAAAVAGLIVALFISHRRGIYYALMTIAFGQIFWFVAIKATSITGGEDGLLKIERLPVISGMASLDLKSNAALYYFVFAVFVVVSVFLWRLVHSPFGRIVKAIKQNEMRARFVGYNVWRYKAAILTLSAGLSGMAGGLFAMAQNSAFPDVMSLHYSGYVVMMTLVGGGLVSYWGPVIGAAAFFLARDVIGAVTTGWMLWFGLSFVILVLFKPEGIAGIFESVTRRERSGPVASGVAPHSVAR